MYFYGVQTTTDDHIINEEERSERMTTTDDYVDNGAGLDRQLPTVDEICKDLDIRTPIVLQD